MMNEPIVVRPGDALSAPGSSFGVQEWEHGPNEGPPLHVHHSDDEAWHVLEGELLFRFSDRQESVGAGSTVFAPVGVAHTYRNPGPHDVRYLIMSTPRVFALIDALHELGPDATEDEAAAVFLKFDSEVLE